MNSTPRDPRIIKRARAYVSTMKSITNSDESPAEDVARVLIHGFSLDQQTALEIMRSDYTSRCTPQMSEQQVLQILTQTIQLASPKPAGWLLNAASQSPAGLSDLGNATYLVEHFGDDLRFCHDWDVWFLWDGTRWMKDRTGGATRKAIESIRKHQAAAVRGKLSKPARDKLIRHLLYSENGTRLNSILEIARNLEPVPVLPEQFDTDPWQLNCRNGTLNLRTGKLHAHRREDLNTKIVPFPYDPSSQCPQWLKFLDKVMAGNKAVIEFIQRLAGYSMTGIVSEHCMAILYGDGRNGKSTFVEVIRCVLNDYATESAPGLLVEQRNASHPTEVADLHGTRFVSNSEIGQGQKLDEAKFKRLTGGDPLKARKLFQDFYQFSPTFMLWMCTNHMPVIRETKEAVWRRLFLIPFLVVIPEAEVDRNLTDKLKSEAAGILAWMVRGCLSWQKGGLNPPPEVLQATQEYRREMDVIGQYISDNCVLANTGFEEATALYRNYENWCEDQGFTPLKQTTFGKCLKAKPQLKRVRGSTGRVVYEGIRLRTATDPALPTAAPSANVDAVTPAEFWGANGVYETSEPYTIDLDAEQLYQAYFDHCRKLNRPAVTMAEIDAYFESINFPKRQFEEDPPYFSGIGLRPDHPNAIEAEASEGLNGELPSHDRAGEENTTHPSDSSALYPPQMSEQDFSKLIE